jgi:hypothetical protein
LQQIVVQGVGSALILVPPMLWSFRMIFPFWRDQRIAQAVELVSSPVRSNASTWKINQDRFRDPSADEGKNFYLQRGS